MDDKLVHKMRKVLDTNDAASDRAGELIQGYMDKIVDAIMPIHDSLIPFAYLALEMHRKAFFDRFSDAEKELVECIQEHMDVEVERSIATPDDEKIREKGMTNFEKIKAMDVSQLAELITELPDSTEFWSRICSAKHCRYYDGEMCLERNSPRDCKTAVKHFLLSEVE